MRVGEGAHKRFDREKFKNLVHYVIATCPDMARFGSVKLHKILWKSDTSHYLQHGESITGAKYSKRKFGPAANAFLPVRDELAREGAIRYRRDRKFAGSYQKDVYESERSAPAGFLTERERSIVDHWIRAICLEHTAASISEETHGYAWGIAAMGEELPMFSVLAERIEEPTPDEVERLKRRAKELGLL